MWNELDANHVARLLRLDYGPIPLAGLAVGECRELSTNEVDALRLAMTGDAFTK